MTSAESSGRVVGRYVFFDEIASGGTATVHLGRLFGSVGFSRVVAIKRLHPSLAKDPGFVAMFVDEARLAARIRHPNVVPILDVVSTDDELFLVLEYVEGEALSRIMRGLREEGAAMPPEIAASILAGVLHGLHAAHEAKSERGEPLDIVHRDVSPQNILLGVDGVSRVFDFGIAKAVGRLQTTQEGQTKGKLAYMSPEQARGLDVDRRTDVYAAGVVFWEALAGRRLFQSDDPLALMGQVLAARVEPPSRFAAGIPAALDGVVMRALAFEPQERFATALDMAVAIEQAIAAPSPREVGRWLEALLGSKLRARADRVAEIESGSVPVPDAGAARGGLTKTAGVTAPAIEAGAVPRTAGRGRTAMIVAAAGLAVGLVVLATHFATRATAANVAPAPVEDRARAHEPEGSPAPSSGSAAPVDPAPVASARATTDTPKAPPPARPAHTARARSSAVASCETPFTVDSKGIRHPRPECLHLTPVSP